MKMQGKYVKSTQKKLSLLLHHCIFNQRPLVSKSIMGYMCVPCVPAFFTEETTSHRTQENIQEGHPSHSFTPYFAHLILQTLFHSVPSLRVTRIASHDINEELTGVSHGHAEGLTWRCEFRGDWGQVPPGRRARCCCYGCLWLGWETGRPAYQTLGVRVCAVNASDGVCAMHAVFASRCCWALAGGLISFFGLAPAAHGSGSGLLRSSRCVCVVFACAAIRATATTACELNRKKKKLNCISGFVDVCV